MAESIINYKDFVFTLSCRVNSLGDLIRLAKRMLDPTDEEFVGKETLCDCPCGRNLDLHITDLLIYNHHLEHFFAQGQMARAKKEMPDNIIWTCFDRKLKEAEKVLGNRRGF